MPTKRGKRAIRRKNRAYVRKRRYKSKVPRHLVPKTYYFNRSQVFDLNLSTLSEITPQAGFFNFSNDDGRDACVAQYRFKLSDVPDWTEFENLFTFYKIPAVSLKMYPSCGIGGGSSRDNSQCIIYTMNHDGRFGPLATATHEEDFLMSQVCQKRLLLSNNTATLITFYQKLKQAIDSDHPGGSTISIMQSPKWIPFGTTNNPQDVYHYGCTQRMQPINNLSLPNVQIKLVIKYYIMCRQVR